MEGIKKKMASLREKLEAAEERSRKAHDELSSMANKAEEVKLFIFDNQSLECF